MPGAVTVLADSGTQFLYLRDELAMRQAIKIFVHSVSFTQAFRRHLARRSRQLLACVAGANRAADRAVRFAESA